MSGAPATRPTREAILAILDTVMDPEVPVLSVRELGIVRDVSVDPDGAATVVVTPTYSGCPAIRVIEQDITSALHDAGIADVRIQTVYSPANFFSTSLWIMPSHLPWSISRSSGMGVGRMLWPDEMIAAVSRVRFMSLQ